MSVHRKGSKWVVRYRDGARQRSRSFDRKADADRFDAEATRRRQLGVVQTLDAGRETLDAFVTEVWAPTHGVTLAPKTRRNYAGLYDHHLAPHLGHVELRHLRPEVIARWQADRLAAGAGPTAVRQALDLLSVILQKAFESERIAGNPVRLVKKARKPRRVEVRPLAPLSVERMRAAASRRDAAMFSVMAYAGLRPGEALALRWGDLRERTLLVERSVSLGATEDTKTTQHRTVRLLQPLRQDLLEFRLLSGNPGPDELVFPSQAGREWSEAAYQSWRRRSFDAARDAAGVAKATPYYLRHSFASLLLHEGRSVIYVARQMGHDARLTLTRYGHVIDELEDSPNADAEEVIRKARTSWDAPGCSPMFPLSSPRALKRPLSRTPTTQEPPPKRGFRRWS
jgi:integrase